MEAINLNRLAYFVAVAETGSFTRAAERLGITKAVVSEQVRRLEADLRTSLLIRTTRRVDLTEAGRLLHNRCVTIFSNAEDAIGEVAQFNAEPRGVLKVTAPNDFGASIVAPAVAKFTQQYPECRVELLLSDTKIDLVEAHIDLAIRVGWLQDSSNLARRIGTFRQFVVAASSANAAGRVAGPADLGALPFIANASLKDPLLWHFTRAGGDETTVRLGQHILTNSTPAALAATLAGGGMSVLPDFLVDEYIRSGQLVRLLPDWELPEGGVHVVLPPARFRPPRVTAFVAMLSEQRLGDTVEGHRTQSRVR
ncbi:LysR family transcriptional regulator [uncultured Devosia sp.]|uniref:LysR family transcriptional regulator n=1 Tax=uncultured Devosia sp. TaxID=211434 RepID=UPI0026269CFB|nr:LysR family transcriptional regulator [uncultured Devosia sp.]